MKFIQKSACAVVLSAASMFAVGTASAAGMSSIADSWHNLGSGNTKGVTPNDGGTGLTVSNKSGATAEICVFCHTPHGGDSTAAVPIWNRKLNAPGSYLRYSSLGTTTFDADEAPIGSVTIACLSCHDGTQAIDSVINAPGSGGYDPNGNVMGGGPGSSMTGTDVDPDGSMREGIVQNLGTDLTNDHPVSMQYAGGGITTASTNSRDPDFTGHNGAANSLGHTLNNMPAPAGSSLGTLWWIERNGDSLNAGGRDREDVILYTRDVGAGAEPFVECGSCHDPHNVENPTFLRVSNSGPMAGYPTANGGPSGLCLTCHMK